MGWVGIRRMNGGGCAVAISALICSPKQLPQAPQQPHALQRSAFPEPHPLPPLSPSSPAPRHQSALHCRMSWLVASAARADLEISLASGNAARRA